MNHRALGKVLPIIFAFCLLSSSCVKANATTSVTPLYTGTQTPTVTFSPAPTLTFVDSTQTPFQSPVSLPYDPYTYVISQEFKEGTSEEEISLSLLSHWLDHLTDANVDAKFRLQSYKISKFYNDSYPMCTQEPGEIFLLVGGVEIETTQPLLCGNAQCDQSAWTAGGGTIIDSHHEYWVFGGPVFKSGNIFRLQVINASPPCP